ncbi:MAG: Mov34/MPN/PAD-1 family protein [Crocinitomicaceae bacterium]|nr:Mov34/MPN/PAD-1 family protein [Crocinitomicaceae bacterium]
MKLTKKHNDLNLYIEEDLIEEIGAIALKHYPNEFGGFLVGKYSSDFKSVEITDVILPKKYKSTPTLFLRSTDGLEGVFQKLFEEKQQYYIGEWHTHPNGSSNYSTTDLDAMIENANCETVQIKNPVLLILSITKSAVRDFTFYYYDNEKLISYEQ